MTTQATRLACTTAVALALSLGLPAPLAAQSSTDTVAIARSEVPGDWSAQMFRGIAFALPPGSQEIILAVAMILILIFRPAGLMAGREVMLPARWVARPDATNREPTQPTGETP